MQVITSFTAERVDEELLLIACTSIPQQEGSWPSLKLAIPKLEGAFTGTGKIALCRLHLVATAVRLFH